ncbi:hypothetical protein [Desulfovibrio sp. JC010]|nr:hypothetical protein [Desulfovibrio sp. JC010]
MITIYYTTKHLDKPNCSGNTEAAAFLKTGKTLVAANAAGRKV